MLDHAGLRRTPAGIAALRIRVAHQGEQHEAGRPRKVELETEFVAFGPVAEALAKQAKGSTLRLAGFLDRQGGRTHAPNLQLELHVTEFEMLNGPEETA